MKMMKRKAYTLVLKPDEAAIVDHVMSLDDAFPETFWDKDSVLTVVADSLETKEDDPVEVLFNNGYMEVPSKEIERVLLELNNIVAELPDDSIISLPEQD